MPKPDHTLYGDIGQYLGMYENIKFLSDFPDVRSATVDFFEDEEDMTLDYAESMRERGLNALRQLVANHVPADRVGEAYDYVVGKYDADWRRFVLDKEEGIVSDYESYLWRGTGPKPYFMGLI
jgi:hypothetical protein